jgi:(p)ppGpp synthase/HD superfamily hydrolase
VDLVERAGAFALDAYGSESRLQHPLEVARLVASAGADEEVVAAALLHDLIEDAGTSSTAIAAGFGSRVAALVSTLTENDSSRPYRERKADLRLRACAAGPDAALILVADKLSSARRMRRGEKDPRPRKISHYEATLRLVRRELPDVPLTNELAAELLALRAELSERRGSTVS